MISFRSKCSNNVSKFFESIAKTEAKQRSLTGIIFPLNGYVRVDRPKSGCHFKAGDAILFAHLV